MKSLCKNCKNFITDGKEMACKIFGNPFSQDISNCGCDQFFKPIENHGMTDCRNCTWAETMCDKDKIYCRAPDNEGQHHFVCRDNWALLCDRFNPKGDAK